MIAKISKGRALKTLARYLLHGSNNENPNRGEVLATNFAGSDIRSWSREFGAFRKLKPNLSRAITHISLNLSPDEREISNEAFIEIATRFKAGLGYTDDCPFLLVRHRDRDHQHIHLVLSRISLTGVIPETNDFRKAEKLAAALRDEFDLKGPAVTKKNKEANMERKNRAEERAERLAAYAAGRLEEASHEGEEKVAPLAEPNAPSVEFHGPLGVKEEREMRREALSDDYQRMLRELFQDQIRYVKKTAKALTVFFKDGGRVHDSGNRIVAYNTPDPVIAAQRLMEMVAMKGWDSGFVVRGSDEFLRAAAAIAISQNLAIVALDAHQSAIIEAVRNAQGGSAALPAASVPQVESTPEPLPSPSPSPSSLLSGSKSLWQRLRDRRKDDEDEDDEPDTGRGPRSRGPRMGG